jgi:hypothetical protein
MIHRIVTALAEGLANRRGALSQSTQMSTDRLDLEIAAT